MKYHRMPIEIESPEEKGYNTIRYNLAESSVRDIPLKDVKVDLTDLVLAYGEHKGKTLLRELITQDSLLTADNALVTPSAAAALFIIHTTLLGNDDHLVVIRPNYGTNLETPRAIGCVLSIVDLTFESRFELDLDAIIAAIRPNTKLISITTPHNPTGRMFSEEKIEHLIELAEQRGCYLLVDETYRELNFQSALHPYYAENSDRVISVCSLSKAYGVPGIRTGWILNKNKLLMKDFLAAKEQIIICNSVVDEEIAIHILQQRKKMLGATHEHVRRNFTLLGQWMKTQEYFEWTEPDGGVVCFPRLKAAYKADAERYYGLLYKKYFTVVGPGHWFEHDKIYMRIGFGYPGYEELQTGLNNLTLALKDVLVVS